jgi:HAD superfamily hydrolase (TIGR01509 family)
MAEGVIFDCDGVLVDSEPITNRILIRSLAAHGLVVDETEAVALFVGGTIAGVGKRAQELGADLPADWVTTIYEEMYATLRQGVPLIPGVVAVLDALDARGIPYAVASNGSLEKMRITLGQTGLWDRFEQHMLSAHIEGVAKPDPELFLRAARRIGVEPADCTVVEDSAPGAKAAKAAGMRCIGYAAHDAGAPLAAEGAIVVRTMEDVARELGL